MELLHDGVSKCYIIYFSKIKLFAFVFKTCNNSNMDYILNLVIVILVKVMIEEIS